MLHKNLKLDWIASVYLGFVILCGIVYTSFQLTPSSYGIVLAAIGAPEEGPVFGVARRIRSDEWGGVTAFFQVAVRNDFQRINESSFYKEDLRNFLMLPVKDWSLIFKPELWAFLVTSPATALALYYSLLMCGFLAGYFLLFRQMGVESLVSASVTVILYFSGFTQFWWTSFHSLLAGLPWIFLLVFAPWRWWVKALLFSWVIPVVVFSDVYPAYFAEFAFAGVVLVAAVRPSIFRSPKELAALAIGGLVTGVTVYYYFHDIIPIMRQTWYPARRVGQPGTTPLPVVLSQIFPFLTFSLRDYNSFSGANVCEGGTIGSFFPLLTLCLISPQCLRSNRALRNGLTAILAAVALIVVWQTTSAPHWIGHILLWDHANAERLLVISGFLLTGACVLVWRDKALSPDPLRIALFVAAGPVLSLALKATLFHIPFAALHFDLILSALGLAAGVVACLSPAFARLPVLLVTIALMNVCAFGEFNPLQSAEPIFNVPETEFLHELHAVADSTPGHIVLESRLTGAVLNGLGFRAVNHLLFAPALNVFREYFPTMDPARFDFIFNRYAYVKLTSDPVPLTGKPWLVAVPIEAFEPARNVRTVTLDTGTRKDCSASRGGKIEQVKAVENRLIVEGWAPWKSEESTQQIQVMSTRPLRAGTLLTVKRPDISEIMADYAYTRSGFHLELSSVDGRPIRADEIVLLARETNQGVVLIPGCGCP